MIYIKSIHIKNFRSIVDEKIELDAFSCFVGLNDSGKSNVLKALNLFFNEETDYGVPFSFNDDYSRFAKRGQKQAKEIIIELEIVVPDSFRESGIKTWKKSWRKEGLNFDNTKKIFKSGSKGYTFLSRMKYLYIPAVKSREYFRGLLSDVYSSMSQAANSSLRTINETYSKELQKLTLGLTTDIHGLLELESSIRMPNDLSVLFRNLTFSTSDKNVVDIDLNHRGDGIRARHIPPILRYIQHNTESSRPKRSVFGSYIWGYEEPENGVEYLSCFEMANEFKKYTDDCQILITTHSPAFYMKSIEDFSTCILTTKQNGISKYKADSGDETYEMMGLMQIVAPFINEALIVYKEDQKNEQKYLANDMRKVMNIMRRSPDKFDVDQILSVFDQYSNALELLDAYDHKSIDKPVENDSNAYVITYDECRKIIDNLNYSGESCLFGNEKDDSFKGVLGNVYQSFGGIDLYSSTEEKAANLLYLITKDHSFSDGNKRIAAAIFVYFLDKNNMLYREDGEKRISQEALVAIVVMIAESRPEEKDTMIRLIMNFELVNKSL